MRCDVYVPSMDEQSSIRFYVEELKLFVLVRDYGMGDILLRYINSDDFHIMLSLDSSVFCNTPLFAVTVNDCDAELDRLMKVNFSVGGVAPNGEGLPLCIEYPLGKFFRLRDPSGNLIVVNEWFDS